MAQTHQSLEKKKKNAKNEDTIHQQIMSSAASRRET